MVLVRPEIKGSESVYTTSATQQIVTVPFPAGTVAGDGLLLLLGSRAKDLPGLPPEGWTLVGLTTISSGTVTLTVYGKIYAASDGTSVLVDRETAQEGAVTCLAVRTGTFAPASIVTGYAGNPNNASSNAPLIPSSTAIEGSSLRVASGMMNQSATTGAGMTKPTTFDREHASGYATDAGSGIRWCVASDDVEAGVTGTANFVSPGTNTSATNSFIIRPLDNVVSAPVAAFLYAPHAGEAPLLVTFSNQTTGSVDTYLWDFGDGATSPLSDPTHVYVSAGVYVVRLTATGSGGSSFVEHSVTVAVPSGGTSLGEEPSLLSVIVGGVYLDPKRVVLPLTHLYGRADPGQQPEAPSVTFGWLGPLTFNYGEIPVSLAVGAHVSLSYDQGGGGTWTDVWEDLWSPELPAGLELIPFVPVFTGRISDLSAETDATDLITQVTAVGVTAEADLLPVGFLTLVQETEAERVQRVKDQASFEVVNDGNTEWLVLSRDPEVATLVQALQELAQSTGAFLWEDGYGRLRYQGSLDRLASSVTFPLTDDLVLAPVKWDQISGNLWTEVQVVYGPPVASPALRPHVTAISANQSSGGQVIRLESVLVTEEDAETYAALIIRHWGEPFWDAPQILVDMPLLSAPAWGALIQANINDLLNIQGVTSVPSVPSGQGSWIVEGWAMTYDRDEKGRLQHSRQYGVSDRDRWSNEALSTVTTATATPASAPFGTVFTVTSTTLDSNGAVVAAGGTVEVWDGTALLASGLVGAGGVAVILATPKDTGTRTLVARYAGTNLLQPSEGTVRVDVTEVTTVTVSMTGTSPVKGGVDKVTLKATVSNTLATGSVEWSYNRDGGGWNVWTGNDSPVVDGKASATWSPSSSQGDPWQWRAKYVPTPGAPFNTATSAAITVNVQEKVSKTLTYGCTGSASYQSDGDKRSDTDDCYQGYYSSTNGNQKSLALMASTSGDWSGYTITKVEARVTSPHWWSAAGGTLVLGSSSSTSLPASWPSATTDRTRKSMERGETLWVDISDWGAVFVTGSARCLAFGPGPSTATTYYGYIQGEGTDEPQLRVTGHVWQTP